MGKGSRVEMIVAVCAVITSVVALAIGWDQARIMRLQQKADIWPMVQVIHETGVEDGRVTYGVAVENAGVGPALIDSHVILVPDAAATEDFGRLVAYVAPEGIGAPMIGNLSVDGRVVRQGTTVYPVRASWEATAETRAAMQARVAEFVSGGRPTASVFICYCSLLDQCWVTGTIENLKRPAEVKSCATLERDARNLAALHGD